jgi:hypothetical protein
LHQDPLPQLSVPALLFLPWQHHHHWHQDLPPHLPAPVRQRPSYHPLPSSSSCIKKKELILNFFKFNE